MKKKKVKTSTPARKAKKKIAPAKKKAKVKGVLKLRKRAGGITTARRGMVLRDFLLDPDTYTIVSTIHVQGEVTLGGNNANEVFVVEMEQPRNSNWRITNNLTHRFTLSAVGIHPIQWPLMLAGTGPRPVTFLIDCRGYLQSATSSKILLDIQIDVP
jgi:hypothetical protein